MISRKQYTAPNYPWLIAFLIWPFGTLITSLPSLGKRYFSLLLVLFYFLYGYTYIIIGKDQDTYRTSQYFAEIGNWTFDDLWNKFVNLYALGNKPDIFQDVLQFILTRFTDDPQIYFAAAATLLAIVAAAIVEDLFAKRDTNSHNLPFALLIGFFLLLTLSPVRINSFRHYLATAVFLWAAFKYLNSEGVKYILILISTSLIHFAFIMVLPLILLYKIIGNRNLVYFILIVVSFVYAGVVEKSFKDYTTDLDQGALQYHATQYTSDLYLKKVDEIKLQRNYFLDNYIFNTSLFFLVIMIYHHYMIKDASACIKNLYSFSLLLFALINFFGNLESVANRFGILYQGFCCLFLVHFYLTTDVKVPYALKVLFAIVLLVNAVVVIRITMQSASLSTILLFFPVSLYSPVEISILEWIR